MCKEAKKEVIIIVELPGIQKEDIKLHGTEDSLTISVDTPKRKYYKEIELPIKVIPQKAKTPFLYEVFAFCGITLIGNSISL